MDIYKKKYKEAFEKIRAIIYDKIIFSARIEDAKLAEKLEEIFPELKENKSEWIEKIRQELKSYLAHREVKQISESDACLQWITWIEKQGEIDKASYEIAEREKYDFVSGQFIECRKSFDVFKEGYSYWFEYVGNDTYIGRSDNILNEEFHITPKQLYCLFTQQHCPKENSVNEETNAPTGYSKYVDECLNEASKHFFSEGEDKYSVADLFYAGVRCGKSWIEKQGEQKPTSDIRYDGVNAGASLSVVNGKPFDYEHATITQKDFAPKDKCAGCNNIKGCMVCVDGDNWAHYYYEDEQKTTDKVEPKFREGEWLCENKVNNYARFIQILGIVNVQGDDRYRISRDIHKGEDVVEFRFVEKYYHKFNISDAKDGDVLDANGAPFIYKKHDKDYVYFYCGVNLAGEFIEANGIDTWNNNNKVYPATKEQRDLLFKKMKEAGYEFDFEKKELKKIGNKNSLLSDFFKAEYERGKADAQKSAWSEEDDNSYCREHCKGYQETGKCFADGDCDAKRKADNKQWNEEDEKMLDNLITYLDGRKNLLKEIKIAYIDWLKTLKPQK